MARFRLRVGRRCLDVDFETVIILQKHLNVELNGAVVDNRLMLVDCRSIGLFVRWNGRLGIGKALENDFYVG